MELVFFFQAEDGIRDIGVTGVQTCALPIFTASWIAGIAATLLILLFVHGVCFPPLSLDIEKQSIQNYRRSNPGISLPTNWQKMKLVEKNSYLWERYAQQHKLRETQKKIFLKENRLKQEDR